MISLIARSRTRMALAAALLASAGVVGGVTAFAQDAGADYKPEYNAAGELLLPKGFEQWVFVGSPLTPQGLNNGKAGFPEYHNVYIQPWAYREYQATNVFPEGTMMFKELQLVFSSDYPDGSRDETSGRGYFPGALNGADVTVKDSVKYADTNGWGFYNFNHSEPKAESASLRPEGECAFCHTASAKKDMVWTQFYVRLDK